MSRVYILIAIVILVPLALLAVLFVLLANPGYYQSDLTNAFKQQTGLELEIGENGIHWRYWPPVALTIRDVKVRPPGAATPLASLKYAAVDLQLWPLVLGKSVTIDGIEVDGMTVNALVDKSGRGNWQPPAGGKPAAPAAAPKKPAKSSAGTSGGGLNIDIRKIDITHSTLNYRDASAGSDYVVSIPTLRTGAVAYGKTTPVTFDVRVTDKKGGMKASLDGKGGISIASGFKHIGFSKLDLHQQLHMPGLKPIDARLRLEGGYDVSHGKLNTQLDGSINGSKVKGKLSAQTGAMTSASFDLSVNRVTAADFLPPPAKATAVHKTSRKAVTAAPADIDVLPLSLLNSFVLHGKLAIGTVHYQTWTFNDVKATVDNAARRLTADVSLKGYGGAASVNFVGSSAASGAGHTRVDVKNIDLTSLTGFKSITGKLTLNSNTTFVGHKLSSILNTLDGTTTFDVVNGTLDVTPIKRVAVAIDAVRGKTSSVAGWPDKMPFKDLKGMHRFVKGTRANQQLSFSLENMSVTGKGGFDYFKNHLGYDLLVTLNATSSGQFTVSSDLAGVKWPIHCAGALNASPADLCRPDKGAIGDILKQELRKHAKKTLEEKAGSLLKGLFGH